MKKTLGVGYVVAAALLVAAGWFGRGLVPERVTAKAATAPVAPLVEVTTARSVEFNPPAEYVGHVEPEEVTDILPQIEGYVKKVCFEEGAFVKAGELLFEIDDEQYVAARNLRYSEVASAESRVKVAQADLERAERYYRRLTSADDRGITATERDNAEMLLASAKATLNAANAAVEEAKASAAIADFNLKHTKVHSPIAGRIGKALHHVGDYVSPSKSALAKVVKTDPMRVAFPVTDRDYDAWQAAAERGGGTLRDARRLRLRLASGALYGEAGKIVFGDNEMNRQTGTLILYVDFANPAGRLVANAFVRVLVDEAKAPHALAVPSGAVQLTDEGRCVWTVDAANRVRSAKVETGRTWKGFTEILKGVGEGTRVVSAGAFKLKDDMTVRVAAAAEAK